MAYNIFFIRLQLEQCTLLAKATANIILKLYNSRQCIVEIPINVQKCTYLLNFVLQLSNIHTQFRAAIIKAKFQNLSKSMQIF